MVGAGIEITNVCTVLRGGLVEQIINKTATATLAPFSSGDTLGDILTPGTYTSELGAPIVTYTSDGVAVELTDPAVDLAFIREVVTDDQGTPARTFRVGTIRHAAPVAGSLTAVDAVVGSVPTVNVAAGFTGENLTYTESEDWASISGSTLTLTDAPRTDTLTITATNSGGSATVDLSVTIEVESVGEIVLTAPAANRVIQYEPDGTTADVTIEGPYTGTPSAIEARIVLASDDSQVVAWETIDAAPTGGDFSGVVTVPRGGPYKVQIRADGGTADVSTTTFSVGLVVLAYGQSNTQALFSANDGATPSYTANTFYYSRDTNEWGGTPTASGVRQLMNDLVSALGYPVGIFDASSGAIQSSQFKPPSGFAYNILTDQLPDVEDFGIVISMQGESDADGVFTKADWKSNWLATKTAIEGLVGRDSVPFAFSSLGTYGGNQATVSDAEWWDIQEGIRELANEQPDVYFSHSAMDGQRVDTVHYSAASYGAFGKRFAQTILNVLGVEAGGAAPIVADAVSASATTTTVNITHDSGSDITPTTGITGFEVSDDAATWITATGIRADADTIILTHASLAATDDRFVRYMYGTLPDISAIVFDNLGYPLVNTASQIIVDYAMPAMTSSAALSTPENLTYVQDLTASRPSTFAIGGTDAALFEIQNGDELHFIAAPDFETPSDSGGNNVYDITITPTAIDNADVGDAQNVAVIVTDEAEAGATYDFLGVSRTNDGGTNQVLNVDTGAATADRFMLVGISKQNGDAVDPTVTVAGQSLSKIAYKNGSYGSGFYGGLVPSGSGLQDVEVIWDNAAFQKKLMSVWVMRGLSSTSPKATPYEGAPGAGGDTFISVDQGDFVFLMEGIASKVNRTDLSGSTEAPTGYRTMSEGSSADWITGQTNASYVIEGYSATGSRTVLIFDGS